MIHAGGGPRHVFHNNKNIQPTTPAQRAAAIG
jgi:hypothetical protein